jgi:hypothetical protein
MVPLVPRRFLLALIAVALVAALAASTASAHTLKAARAANASNLVAKEVCRGFVGDPELGTCVDWISGPCRRVSAHAIRCQMVHLFEKEDGSQIRCRQVQEWFIRDGSGDLRARLVPGSARCRQTQGPSTTTP